METANSTSERGIGWQALGFAVVGCAGVAILELWSESGSWVYESFETAVTRLYWAFVVPLAALFDWGRRMFETRQEIRKAAREKAIRKAVEKERKEFKKELDKVVDEDRRRIMAALEQYKGLPRKEIERTIFQVDRP